MTTKVRTGPATMTRIRDGVLAGLAGGIVFGALMAATRMLSMVAMLVGSIRTVGATGAFDPVLDGQRLTFPRTDDGLVDAPTGSTWNLLGEAVNGPLVGERLDPVDHVDTAGSPGRRSIRTPESNRPADRRPAGQVPSATWIGAMITSVVRNRRDRGCCLISV